MVYVCGHTYVFMVATQVILAWAPRGGLKWALRRTQNIFVAKNKHCIFIDYGGYWYGWVLCFPFFVWHRGLTSSCENGKSEGVRGLELKFPPWQGSEYFLETHIGQLAWVYGNNYWKSSNFSFFCITDFSMVSGCSSPSRRGSQLGF